MQWKKNGSTMGAVVLSAAMLLACSGEDTTTTGAAGPGAEATATSAAAAASSTTVAGAAGAASSSTTAGGASAGASTGAASDDATPAVVAAANAFLATLSESEKAAVTFDWSDTAQKQRWSNFPEGLFERDGLMWGDLSDAQRQAWLGLMQASLSARGYQRVLEEWAADDQLAASGSSGGPGGASLQYGQQYYWVAIIGTPSVSSPWQWQWGGHHVTVNATVADSTVSITPSFIGDQPASYTDASGKTVRPLGDVQDAAFALINALDSSQQSTAILGSSPIDLVLGPGEDGKTLQAEGLAGADMTEAQRDVLFQLMSYYGAMVNDEDAAARLEELRAGLDETFFAWYGPTTAGSAAYFRVTGPTIVIEYSPQSMGGNAANHIHGIYRDPTNEYGARYTS